MSISFTKPIQSLRSRLGEIENWLPGKRPPALWPSKEKLTVLKTADTVVPPSAPQGPVPGKTATLSLMTYNTWGLQGFLGQRQEERMNQIGIAVRGHGIVALQETFTKHASAIGRLSQYKYQLTGSDGGPFRSSGGLKTLSSHPVLETDFAAFDKASHADRLAHKGVLFMRTQVPGIGPVDIYNTHFQAQGGNEAIRQYDNDVMVALIKKHEAGNPTFIMGDFNYTPSSEQYKDLVSRLGLRDTAAEFNPADPGATSTGENTNNNPAEKPSRIDYIFAMPNARFDIAIDSVQRAMTETFNGKHASDHFGVIGEYRITPKAAPGLRPLIRITSPVAVSATR